MHSMIENRTLPLPLALRTALPPRLLAELEELAGERAVRIEELHLRRGCATSLTVNGKNRRLRCVLDGGEMDATLLSLCDGSLYTHGETLCQGFLSAHGLRVGVCGHANVVEGRVVGVSNVSALVIRLPHKSPPVGEEICALLRTEGAGGVLLFAPPAVGKTTLLRAVAARMAGGVSPRRVALVDTRGELAAAASDTLLIDLLSCYPRGVGISIAARTLAAELIVCDEIGDLAEAREILSVNSCGVPLLASAHGNSLRELLARPGIRALHEAHCFDFYVRIRRRPDAFDFIYEITSRETADVLG